MNLLLPTILIVPMERLPSEEDLQSKLLPRNGSLRELLQGLDGIHIDVSTSFKFNLNDDSSLDEFYEWCRDRSILHPDWSLLAGRVKTLQIIKHAPTTFSEATKEMQKYNLFDTNYYNFVTNNTARLNAIIDNDANWKFTDFAMGTGMHTYLIKVSVKTDQRDADGNVVWKKRHLETFQYMYLRAAVFIRFAFGSGTQQSLFEIEQIYNHLKNGEYTFATPTLCNTGRRRHQLSSCFLIWTDDSMDSIEDSWTASAEISRNSGGIGISYASLRHSEIAQQGVSGGLVRWAKILNEILMAVDQGGLRKGSGAVYIEPWHVDIISFLELPLKNGAEDMRARDLFYALWIPDLFMKRVQSDDYWTLMCPHIAIKEAGVDLTALWGDKFDEAYLRCEEMELRGAHRVKARTIWKAILKTQIETGMPYMLYKDACNRKSNQRNLGTIKCSNLCSEIIQYSDNDEIASCNLASVALPSCVLRSDVRKGLYFSFPKLIKLMGTIVRNLNSVIDRNYYPERVPAIRRSNFKHRPIGIGMQGLADVFAMLDLTWESEEARQLNRDIAEAMYYGAVKESIELAKEEGHYESFPGSPASQGLFQFDLWDIEEEEKRSSKPVDVKMFLSGGVKFTRTALNPNYNWEALRSDMIEFGLRNSLLIANMPTASTASILGNNEAFEPFTQTNYARLVLSGKFVLTNTHMVKDLEEINWWNTTTVKSMLANQGTILHVPLPSSEFTQKQIEELSPEQLEELALRDERMLYLKQKYKNVFELSQQLLSDYNLDRARFVCQSQSFNCWMKRPTSNMLTSFHFYNWERGAKTGMYYLRQSAKTEPINYALNDFNVPIRTREVDIEALKRHKEECVNCSS